MSAKVRLTSVGGDSQYHYAHFILEYGRTTARISIEVEGPAPRAAHQVDAYRKLLRHLGALAQKAASSDELLMPTRGLLQRVIGELGVNQLFAKTENNPAKQGSVRVKK